jgi:hypothetical protein
MALYFLDYDLRKQRDYERLYTALREFGAVRILESLWCFKRFNTSTVSLRDHFKAFVDADDGLCVSEVTDWATWKARGTPNELK